MQSKKGLSFAPEPTNRIIKIEVVIMHSNKLLLEVVLKLLLPIIIDQIIEAILVLFGLIFK